MRSNLVKFIFLLLVSIGINCRDLPKNDDGPKLNREFSLMNSINWEEKILEYLVVNESMKNNQDTIDWTQFERFVIPENQSWELLGLNNQVDSLEFYSISMEMSGVVHYDAGVLKFYKLNEIFPFE